MAKDKTLLDGTQINYGEGLRTDAQGKLALNVAGIRDTVGIGDLGKLNSAPISKGGTGSSNPVQARTNLSIGSAANRNVGTAAGDVPVIGENGELAAKEFITGTSSKITDKEVVFNGDIVLKTPVEIGLQQIATLSDVTEPLTAEQVNTVIHTINSLVNGYNQLLNVLSSHHKLIK